MVVGLWLVSGGGGVVGVERGWGGGGGRVGGGAFWVPERGGVGGVESGGCAVE